MIMKRVFEDGQWGFRSVPDGSKMTNIHPVSDECLEFGCVVHSPTPGPMSNFPYNWRMDRGIMERICPHGIGHPDSDSAAYFERTGRGYENVHGCDGCDG